MTYWVKPNCMQLSNVLSKKVNSSEIIEKYFTCLIEDSFVTLAIWGVINDKPKVLAVGTPKEWLDLTLLTDAVELGLEEFHEQAEGVTRVLFSLPEGWVSEADIKAEYKEVLKKITHKLVLHPIGFVVTLEALFEYIFQFKTSSARILYLQLGASEYTLYLTEHGHVVQKEVFGKSEQFADDLVEGLTRLEKQPLPAQMYFFSFEVTLDQLEQDKQLFLAHDWDSVQLFHHLPTIDLLGRSDMIEAACIAGGSETLHGHVSVSGSTQISETLHEVPMDLAKTSPENMDNFGFTEVSQSPPSTDEPPKVYSFGVPIPPKVMKTVEPPPTSETETELEPEYAIDESLVDETPRRSRKAFKLSLPSLPSFGTFFSRPSEPREHHPRPRNRSRTAVLSIIVGGGLFLMIGVGVYGWVVLQRTADIAIVLKTLPVSADATIALDPKIAQTDPDKKILKVAIVNKEETDQEETSTTGSKIIGEKAKGTVTILNKTSSIKTIAKGTEIKLGSKIYLTDADVTLASASTKETSSGQTTDYGKKDVSVTAKEIGADFNLDKNTDFTIANFGKDTYAARNDQSLGGGSSREIQAVSKEDQQKLSASLKKSLMKKAETEMKTTLPAGEYLVLSGKSQVSSEVYSAKVGEETDKLSLTMTVKVEGYSYKAEDLKPIAKEQLSSLVPDGGALLEDKIEILSKESQSASSSAALSLDATLSSVYTPPTNSDEWLDGVKGKTMEQSKRILSERPEIKSVIIHLNPSIAEFLVARLPDDKKKISIKKSIE